MATIAGVGASHDHNPNIAGREAAGQALENAGIAKPRLRLHVRLLSATISPPYCRLCGRLPEVHPLSGCSSEGTIGGDDADESNFSVVITTISSDELQWHNGIVRGLL